MRKITLTLIALLSAMMVHSQLEEEFRHPPVEMSNHVILGWDGQIDSMVIERDLDAIQSCGFRSVIIEPGYHMGDPYLSQQWFANVRMMADAVERRGMKMWIIDEGKYPSGMAGGKFSKERPDLCMQALVVEGDTVKAVRRSSNTRCVNNPTGGKDETNSLCDYLDTAAVRQYINWTHEQYKQTLGHHLGTTVLGFRGDEPAYQRAPWTTGIDSIFEARKGYSLKPWLKALTMSERTSLHHASLTEEQRRAKADYWDVWSSLFANHYFKMQADWCESNGLRHITHMDKDDMLAWCVRMEGDPFRNLSRVQVPGIDVIWSQIWYGSYTEFPRLASSTAHVYGKQRAFSESFAAYTRQLDIPSVKYVVDYQIARGINFFEFMFMMSKREPTGYMANPAMKTLNEYTNRATYLMSQGRPTARVAVYAPIPSLWLGNDRSDHFMRAAGHLLTAHQYDYDFITDDGLVEAVNVSNGRLLNKSGQAYETLVIPNAEVIRQDAWQRIEEFTHRGGKVVFLGDLPHATAERSMMNQQPITIPQQNTLHVTDSVWTDAWTEMMPVRELQVVEGRGDSIAYTARQTADARIFFILNQRSTQEALTIDLDCMGEPQLWDAWTGEITDIPFTVVGAKTRVPLTMQPWESRIIVVKRRTAEYNTKHFKSIQAAIDQAHADGGGTVVIPKGKHRTGSLFVTRGVNLHLDEGATLISIVDPSQYPIIRTRWEGRMQDARAALINFINNDGCTLTGKGLIDARGLKWNKVERDRYGRPKTICFDHCDGGAISGISVKNQAFWCLHVLFTNGFTIDGVNICAEDYIPSSDGIDIDSSTDVVIRNVHIEAHDDCISIKSGKDTDGRRVNLASERILIENCHFDYGHGGVAIGSEVTGDVRDVTVRHCDMSGENWNPIRFKSQPSRGGIVERITFEDIDISQARNIFEVNMTWRMKGATEPPYSPLTRLRDITFRNIRGKAENAGHFIGYEDQPFTPDIFHFENCEIQVQNPFENKYAELNMEGLKVVRGKR